MLVSPDSSWYSPGNLVNITPQLPLWGKAHGKAPQLPLWKAHKSLLEFSIRDFHTGQAIQTNITTKTFKTEVLNFSASEFTWIYFPICPNAISINNVLKARSKLVSFVVCGWGLIGLHPV